MEAHHMQHDNRGFSLVELIIVVAMSAALLGVMGYGMSLSDGKPAQECARKLASALQHGRTETMGKYRNVITVTKEADGRLTVTETPIVKIEDDGTVVPGTSRVSVAGSKGVTVEYKIGSGGYTELAPGNSIELRFDSGSGALKPIVDGGTDYYTGFRLSKAGTVWYVTIQYLTGKVTASGSDTP